MGEVEIKKDGRKNKVMIRVKSKEGGEEEKKEEVKKMSEEVKEIDKGVKIERKEVVGKKV